MNNADARPGRPRWLVKILPLFLSVLLVIFCYSAYLIIEKEVTIIIDGTPTDVKTLKSDVAGVLEENNIEIYPKDLVYPDLSAKLEEGQVIKITRAFDISVIADGKEAVIRTTPETVEKILAEAQILLGEKDLVEPDLSTVAGKDTSRIVVSRITEEFITKTKPIAYRVEQKEDSTLERGIRRILQRGKEGLKEETIKITYKDGEKISEEVVAVKTVKEPVTQVVSYGVLQYASRGGQRFEFSRALEARASAYTHTGSRTSTGTNPKVGTVAVDPAVIPLGSKLYVEGYGFGRAEDTGSSIKGNSIDVFMETERECLRWGRRTVKVYILK
ncbi:MAG: ubiquitin-like domain-containing protein [Bacillota bacterium]|jgi:uncharacterized protein YabE (DUF348 family)|nr:DUF348 domain-containing protein [Clostridia bacterium]